MQFSEADLKHFAIHLSKKKLEALEKLSIPGIRLSDGYDYHLCNYILPETTLGEVRKRLSSIKTSLSEEVAKERRTE